MVVDLANTYHVPVDGTPVLSVTVVVDPPLAFAPPSGADEALGGVELAVQ